MYIVVQALSADSWRQFLKKMSKFIAKTQILGAYLRFHQGVGSGVYENTSLADI